MLARGFSTCKCEVIELEGKGYVEHSKIICSISMDVLDSLSLVETANVCDRTQELLVVLLWFPAIRSPALGARDILGERYE